MEERRRTQRFRQQIPVRYQRDGGDERMGFTDDAGPDGVFVFAMNPEKPGTVLAMEIDLPKHGTIKFTGEAVHSEDEQGDRGGFGVRVTKAPDEWYAYWTK